MIYVRCCKLLVALGRKGYWHQEMCSTSPSSLDEAEHGWSGSIHVGSQFIVLASDIDLMYYNLFGLEDIPVKDLIDCLSIY